MGLFEGKIYRKKNIFFTVPSVDLTGFPVPLFRIKANPRRNAVSFPTQSAWEFN